VAILGGSMGPLLAALIIAPYGQQHIALFAVLAVIAILAMIPICKWYRRVLQIAGQRGRKQVAAVKGRCHATKRFFHYLFCLYLFSLNTSTWPVSPTSIRFT
jgi:FSR family fosmidomycin resistance protein-like MFS transporter